MRLFCGLYFFLVCLGTGTTVASQPDEDDICLKLGILPLIPDLENIKQAGQHLFSSIGQCVDFIAAPVRRAEAMTVGGTLDGEFLRTQA